MEDFRRAIETMMHLSVLPDVLDAGHIAMQQEDRRIEREIEARFGCLICGQKHEARPLNECQKAIAQNAEAHRVAMAQLIKELGMQDKAKIVLGVDAGSTKNSILKLRGVKAFLDEMKAARKRRKRLAKKCATHKRRKRLAMRQAKRQAAKIRKQAMRYRYWCGLPGKAKEALARNKYAHGSQQWADDLICSLAVGSDETKTMYWFSADIDDSSGLWCWRCAKKRLIAIRRESPAKLQQWLGWKDDFFYSVSDEDLCNHTKLIDGGWGTEEDGPRYCDGCGCRSEHLLTDYGVDQELEYLEYESRLSLKCANGWAHAHDAVTSMSDDDPRCHRLINVVLSALNKRHGKPTRLCRNARLKVHRARYQKWVSDNVKTVLTRYPDPITGKIVPKEQATVEQIDMRFALKNLVHDGLKVGDVLGKRSLAINSTFGHTSIHCNGREVVCFDMVQGPPRKYQRKGWMLLRHLEKIAARRPKARWTVTMCHDAKEFCATWERKRPRHWVITRIDDRSDYPIADRMMP